MRVRVFDDADALAELAATTVAGWLRAGDGRVTLGLAGGGTPRTTYARLRDETVPWERVDAWLGDERWVPPRDPDHNGTMARRALADHVPLRFHEIPWEAGSPEEAAARYEETLRGILVHEDRRPRPDVVILGLGEDGHCASLFPGTEALEERDRLYVANRIPKLDAWRLTATPPLLRAARRTIFLVTGAQKADAVAEVLEGEESPMPARRILDGEGDLFWFLDRAAASRLETTEVERV